MDEIGAAFSKALADNAAMIVAMLVTMLGSVVAVVRARLQREAAIGAVAETERTARTIEAEPSIDNMTNEAKQALAEEHTADRLPFLARPMSAGGTRRLVKANVEAGKAIVARESQVPQRPAQGGDGGDGGKGGKPGKAGGGDGGAGGDGG